MDEPPCAPWALGTTAVSPEDSTEALTPLHCLGAFVIVFLAIVLATALHYVHTRRWRRDAAAVRVASQRLRKALGDASPFRPEGSGAALLSRLGELSSPISWSGKKRSEGAEFAGKPDERAGEVDRPSARV